MLGIPLGKCGLCPVCTTRQTARDGHLRTPSPAACSMAHGTATTASLVLELRPTGYCRPCFALGRCAVADARLPRGEAVTAGVKAVHWLSTPWGLLPSTVDDPLNGPLSARSLCLAHKLVSCLTGQLCEGIIWPWRVRCHSGDGPLWPWPSLRCPTQPQLGGWKLRFTCGPLLRCRLADGCAVKSLPQAVSP